MDSVCSVESDEGWHSKLKAILPDNVKYALVGLESGGSYQSQLTASSKGGCAGS